MARSGEDSLTVPRLLVPDVTVEGLIGPEMTVVSWLGPAMTGTGSLVQI